MGAFGQRELYYPPDVQGHESGNTRSTEHGPTPPQGRLRAAFTGGCGLGAARWANSSGPSDDLAEWYTWWEFNKHPYLTRTSAEAAARAPFEAVVRDQAVAALLAALETQRNKNIVTGAMVALAKLLGPGSGTLDERNSFAGMLRLFLSDPDLEIQETAAVSLGILGPESSIPILAALALDTREGQRLVRRTPVPARTRAFAIYGMGAIGFGTEDETSRKQIVDTLVHILGNDGFQPQEADVSVAALTALGLTPLASNPSWRKPGATWVASECREAQVLWILDYYRNDQVDVLVRAHAPAALARLLQSSNPRSLLENEAFPALKEEVAWVLIRDIAWRAPIELQRSAVLALGLLGDADDDEIDREIRTALIAAVHIPLDPQACRLTHIALGQVGGRPGQHGAGRMSGTAVVRDALLSQLSCGTSTQRPWAALAIGVLERSLSDAGGGPVPSKSTSAVRSALVDAHAPRDVGAFAMAAGIMRDADSKSALLEALGAVSDTSTKSYCALALGLLGDPAQVGEIQRLPQRVKYQREILTSCVTALGLLSDPDIVGLLANMLAESKALSAQAAIAQALGVVGDASSIQPLVDMLANEDLTGCARGFAAVALGNVADEEGLPWSAKISASMNYRAVTPTLTDPNAGTGILHLQ